MKLVKEDYDRSELESLKRDVAKQHQGSCPSNISLLQTYHKLVENETIESSEQIEKDTENQAGPLFIRYRQRFRVN